jgi:uncharacterized protein YdaU (DUF1376 family)
LTNYPDFIAVNAEAEMQLTRDLGLGERGVLQTMLLTYWQDRQPLPASDRAIAAIAGVRVGTWRRCKGKVMPFFDKTPNGLIPSSLALEFQRPGEEWDELIAAAQEGGAE